MALPPSRAALVLLALPLWPAPAPQGPGGDRSEVVWEMGRRALESGRVEEALGHGRVLLARDAADARGHGLVLRATVADADARAAASWDAARALADGAGSVRWGELGAQVDATLRRRLETLALARTAAARELAELATRRGQRSAQRPEERLVALWARRFARELCAGSPALERELVPRLDPLLAPEPDDARAVVRALDRAAKRALSAKRTDEALRAARILRGLGVQAGFRDLEGPPPRGVEGLAAQSAALLARLREQLAKGREPWTVDELSLLMREEGERFTREHDCFARPGLARSPRDWYRIETECGFQTLLGVAETIEDHHGRLATWYGTDPFAGRPGLVRVVAEASGLEAEGTPFWWAGGFQSGDTTTVRFACGTIEGLGRTLTHELTHRFDGVLFPGQPAWLTEGKAVWTGAAYAHSSDREFVPNHALFGTLQGAWIKGYGGLEKLTELLEGTIEDYRDNYVAGYALYLYLATEERGGERPFAARLRRYMEGCRDRRADPKAWFVESFCDGLGGRPAGLEAFAEAFGTFIGGFYWRDPKPWTERYTQDLPGAGGAGHVYDEPTWVWSRQRAEPWFGEGQARLAGSLLAELGDEEEALRALVWGLAVDGRSPRAERELSGLLERSKHAEASFALLNLLDPRAAGPAPAALPRALPRTRAYLEALAAAADELGGWAGARLAAERDALAAFLGAAPIAAAPPEPPGPLLGLDPPARHPGALGYGEDGLTGYEERRVSGLWFADEHGHVHVGRSRPREGTGSLDPRAHQRDAFVRTKDWLGPGVLRVRCRVRFTTSFASGAIVLGYARRDRNVRVGFSAGDFLYSIGEKEEAAALDGVSWSVHGLFEREGALPGSRPAGRHEFPQPTAAFRLELLIDGAALHLSIDGTRLATYHTADGSPIEGHLGFASSFGAYEVSELSVERLSIGQALGLGPTLGLASLDLERGPSAAFHALLGHAARGLAPATTGTLVLWVAAPALEPGEDPDPAALVARAQAQGARLASLLARLGATQPLALVVPAALGPQRAEALRAALREGAGREVELLLQPEAEARAGWADPDEGHRSWLALVDPVGAVRFVDRFFGLEQELPPGLVHWLDTLRDHGRPPRELPPIPRGQGQGVGDEPGAR